MEHREQNPFYNLSCINMLYYHNLVSFSSNAHLYGHVFVYVRVSVWTTAPKYKRYSSTLDSRRYVNTYVKYRAETTAIHWTMKYKLVRLILKKQWFAVLPWWCFSTNQAEAKQEIHNPGIYWLYVCVRSEPPDTNLVSIRFTAWLVSGCHSLSPNVYSSQVQWHLCVDYIGDVAAYKRINLHLVIHRLGNMRVSRKRSNNMITMLYVNIPEVNLWIV